MTNTKYIRDEVKKINKDKLKLNSLYGQMVTKAYKSGTTHANMEDLNNDKNKK